MYVISGDSPGSDLDGGLEEEDVVVLDQHAGRVAVDVVDGRTNAARGVVGSADGGVLDGDVLSVAQADAEEIAVAGDLNLVHGDIIGLDVQHAADVQAGDGGAVRGDIDRVGAGFPGPSRPASGLAGHCRQAGPGRHAAVR